MALRLPLVPLIAACCLLTPVAPTALHAADDRPDETSQQRDARLQWFRDARFGLFIHWGVYAVPAGEYHGKEMGGIGEWIMNKARIPIAEYKGFAPSFTAAKYDPDAWAALAAEAGVKYVVITSKHHDGFALFDSAVSEWNAVKASGAKRDLIAPLATAVRAHGLKFGLYYSQAQDWTNPGGAKNGFKTGENWDPAQAGDFDTYLQKLALPQVDEILTRFHPDVLWWDTPTDMTRARAEPFAKRVAREPNVIQNNRLGSYAGDTMTPEQEIPPRGYGDKMFEVCMTMNDTWGFKKNDHHWKDLTDLVRKLSDIASKGGNFLLNVGPTAEGEIPAESIERLKGMGRWLKTNGEAIYGTRASPFFRRLEWGRATRLPRADGGETLYLHVWEWPADGTLTVPGLDQQPTAGHLLGDNAAVTWNASPQGLVLRLPGAARDAAATVVALSFTAPVEPRDTTPAAGADGRIALDPHDADCHGDYSGNLRLVGAGADTHLADWTGQRRVEYLVRTPEIRAWTVTAELRVPTATALRLKAGKTETKVELQPTGDGWKEVDLGRVELPAGPATFTLQPAKDGWKPVELRRVWLTPAK